MKAPCRECGVIITNMKNVGEERNIWGAKRAHDFLCMDCYTAKRFNVKKLLYPDWGK